MLQKPDESPKPKKRLTGIRASPPQLGNVHWNLQPWALGPSHLRRVIDVLTDRDLGPKFGKVSLSEFEHMERPDVIVPFAQCFQNWPPEEESDSDALEDDSKLPKLLYYNQELPVERLPDNL